MFIESVLYRYALLSRRASSEPRFHGKLQGVFVVVGRKKVDSLLLFRLHPLGEDCKYCPAGELRRKYW
jgi:hypothetical protein